jgi:hypothetical protein
MAFESFTVGIDHRMNDEQKKKSQPYKNGFASGKRLSVHTVGAPIEFDVGFNDGRHEAVRDCGYSIECLNHPAPRFSTLLLCAFNGTRIESVPPAWFFHPNPSVGLAWLRVKGAIDAAYPAIASWQDVYMAYVPRHGRPEGAQESTIKAWTRVAEAGHALLS